MITTRLTKRFGIKHPIVLAPMTPASGGALASAVAAAGGLGLLGEGYVDRVWFDQESAKVTRSDVGAGFITWTIPEDMGLLDLALERHPRAMMLAFSDPGPYAPRIKKAGVPMICQVHTLEHAFHAVDVGADVVVAQGTEAGGHGLGGALDDAVRACGRGCARQTGARRSRSCSRRNCRWPWPGSGAHAGRRRRVNGNEILGHAGGPHSGRREVEGACCDRG